MNRILAAASLLLALVGLASAAACTRFGSCEAQQANGFSTTCSGPAGWVWTGSACIWTRACNCSGSDCGSMYGSKGTCQTAHAGCAY